MVAPSRLAFRSQRNYYTALVSELSATILRGWANAKARGDAQPKDKWRKLLLVGANHIGDILYRTCALEALARGLPDCRLHIIAPFPASEALEGNPYIEKIHRFELPRNERDPGFESLREEEYDAAICYDSGMYIASLRLAVALGIPNRVAYAHKGFSGWVTQRIAIDYPQPFALYFRDLVGQIAEMTIEEPCRPRMYPSAKDVVMAHALWEKEGLTRFRKVVAIFCSSRQPSELWPAEHFQKLVSLICADKSVGVILAGAAVDRATLESIAGTDRGQTVLCAGDLNLREMCVLLSMCQAAIVPDSGSRHISNASGIPVFFFRNLQSLEEETGKYCDNEEDLCPTGSYLSQEQQQKVLRGIAPSEVYERVRPLLEP